MGKEDLKTQQWKNIEEKPVKIDKWDTAALKNALDDGAKKVMLDKFGFKESHSLMDGRLFICTIAVGFAMFALIWDYFNPFPESRPVLIICVLSYFFLMGVLTVYTTYKEKGIFLVALDKDRAGVDPDNRWELSSILKKYDDKYTLSMNFIDGTSRKSRSGKITKSVAEFFDENGTLCIDRYEPEVRMLQNRIATDKKE
ncbi:signal peptidase complex subunit 2-like isoform X2 [Mercenaria mercenaria]|uniref:signal peptidase complex subunit 2-like isoform X2 n=1 Tax=Mercenaria mercenaria TaxID=6596 RepID=UPI00234F5C1B|nr:signal peptidase complex subunit 2-like isoform X2 [Mercenaria mercenaria]